MAIRGVYNADEEKMITDFKKKAEGGDYWVMEEATPESAYPVYHRVATKDLILSNANGLGDNNPLWRNENYARNTRWGGIIAHPLFPFAICPPIATVSFNIPPGYGRTFNITVGTKWEFYKPIHVGDTFKIRAAISPAFEDVTSIDGTGPRLFLVYYYRKYINQNDEVVCKVYRRALTVIMSQGMETEKLSVLPL